jgi:hypothetical protein
MVPPPGGPIDPPLEVLETQGCYVATVIDLAGVRLQRGVTDYKLRTEKCKHKKMIYCATERRIWCEDCSRTIEHFEAFMVLVDHHAEMIRQSNSLFARAKEALTATIRTRAAKELDKVWGGRNMVPCCPHCRRGLLPEHFANGVGMCVSRDYEVARLKREKEPKQP